MEDRSIKRQLARECRVAAENEIVTAEAKSTAADKVAPYFPPMDKGIRGFGFSRVATGPAIQIRAV